MFLRTPSDGVNVYIFYKYYTVKCINSKIYIYSNKFHTICMYVYRSFYDYKIFILQILLSHLLDDKCQKILRNEFYEASRRYTRHLAKTRLASGLTQEDTYMCVQYISDIYITDYFPLLYAF